MTLQPLNAVIRAHGGTLDVVPIPWEKAPTRTQWAYLNTGGTWGQCTTRTGRITVHHDADCPADILVWTVLHEVGHLVSNRIWGPAWVRSLERALDVCAGGIPNPVAWDLLLAAEAEAWRQALLLADELGIPVTPAAADMARKCLASYLRGHPSGGAHHVTDVLSVMRAAVTDV